MSGRATADNARFVEACSSLGLNLTDEQVDAFARFEERLYEANKVMNLTRVPREECWLRHFVDSLSFQDLLPAGSLVLDIGTGPGFPAWPLAAARRDLRVVALDSSGKMLGFLRKNPLPNLEVVEARAEEWGVRERFDVVTGRAVAPLPAQLEISAAPAKVGGLLIPMRSANEVGQIGSIDASRLGLQLDRVERRALPGTDIVRVFPVFNKVATTPREFPRRWAEIRSKPLFD